MASAFFSRSDARGVYETQEFERRCTKDTLCRVNDNAMLFKPLQDQSEVPQMLCRSGTGNEKVVDVAKM